MAKRKTIAEHARDVLIETNNPAVMLGDNGLLDMIFERAGMREGRDCGPTWNFADYINAKHARVLDALEGSPLFQKQLVNDGRGRGVRLFRLIKLDNGEK